MRTLVKIVARRADREELSRRMRRSARQREDQADELDRLARRHRRMIRKCGARPRDPADATGSLPSGRLFLLDLGRWLRAAGLFRELTRAA